MFSSYELGDCSQDSTLNVLDVIFIINNCIFSNEEICSTCSDIDLNGTINVLDVVGIVNDILAGGGTQDDCATAASDYNGDGTVNVLDVVAIVNIILAGGGRTADATEAKMTQTDNSMNIGMNTMPTDKIPIIKH